MAVSAHPRYAVIKSGACKLLSALALTSTVTLAACPRQSAVWIEGQEAPGRPVFGVGRSLHGPATWLGLFIVAPCAGFDGTARTARWFLVQDGEPRAISELTYGRVPPGYAATKYMSSEQSQTAVAPPLGPGCYIAATSGTGQVRFMVEPDSSVHEVERQQ
jgi:hypothetical protein